SPGGRLLADIARERGTSPRAVALSFLTRRPNLFAIPKAGRVTHVLENARAGELRLTEAEISRIDEAFPVRAQAALPTL
ncbi:MAG: aldo/keto reductase, partial [Deltaproteobacteria bacterium]|nr:aldo/keto reductase [Deltaproteobacteria bacterium]